MFRHIRFFLAVALLATLAAGAFALAETEIETFTFYRRIDDEKHRVCVETWEYPVVKGERGSGKVIDEEEYEEPHTIVDGRCIYCEPIDKALDIAAPTDIERAEGETQTSFASAYGAIVKRGDDARTVLMRVFDALTDNARVIIGGVEAKAADALIALVKGDASLDELMAALSDFPARTVDGAECRIVVLIVCDDWGEIIVDNYAFSAEDGALVRVY